MEIQFNFMDRIIAREAVIFIYRRSFKSLGKAIQSGEECQDACLKALFARVTVLERPWGGNYGDFEDAKKTLQLTSVLHIPFIFTFF